MQKPNWKFWLFGVFVVVFIEVLHTALLLSQGYVVWVPLNEEPVYWVGSLIGYALLVAIVASSSAWLWQKINRRNL